MGRKERSKKKREVGRSKDNEKENRGMKRIRERMGVGKEQDVVEKGRK